MMDGILGILAGVVIVEIIDVVFLDRPSLVTIVWQLWRNKNG